MLQLALKHRQNKSQRQRIIVFTCSALPEDEKSLVKLAKRMKKNNINVDIIAFGDLAPENVKKLEAFNENVKGGDGSHLAIIPPSSNLLSDAIVTTPIIGGEAASGGGAGGAGAQGGEGGGQEWEFGVDPSMDPELALALRMSYEEEKARQERERKAQENKEGKSELEGIAEEGGDESKPLLDKSGEPSGSGSGSKDPSDKKDKDDGDKMDTA